MMKAPQHDDLLAFYHEEKGVGESTKDSLPHMTVDGGECFGEPQDSSGRSVSGPREFGTQAAGFFLIPGPGLKDVEASFRAEPQTHRPQP